MNLSAQRFEYVARLPLPSKPSQVVQTLREVDVQTLGFCGLYLRETWLPVCGVRFGDAEAGWFDVGFSKALDLVLRALQYVKGVFEGLSSFLSGYLRQLNSSRRVREFAA